MGYGDMLYGIEAGLRPQRALAMAKKLQPKRFEGKIAMYYANTSTEPDPIITEETLESMPQPHEIRTVQGVRYSSFDSGRASAHQLIDAVSGLAGKVPHTDMQQALEQKMNQERNLAASHLHPTATREPAPFEDSRVAEEDDGQDFIDDEETQDTEGGEIAPKWLKPDTELEEMSPATRGAVTKVRDAFSGSLHFYQPTPGEITEYFDKLKSRKGVSPSHRTALTSATATSVRGILSGNRAQESPVATEVENVKRDPSKRNLVKRSKIAPKPFFDYSKIVSMSSSDFTKSKRAKETDLVTPLKDYINLPQICVVGRSNVGKSSLLNAIMGPNFKKLVVSKTPGRTQYIQMLNVSKKLVVVDMPGYGYAAASPQARKAMEERIGEYLVSKLPRRVFLLIDSRRGVTSADIRIADSLDQLHIVYQVVLTKIDKISSIEAMTLTEKSIKDWVNRRPCAFPEVLKTSSKSRSGIDQLRLAVYTACGFTL